MDVKETASQRLQHPRCHPEMICLRRRGIDSGDTLAS
jgi:hypothetical protein